MASKSRKKSLDKERRRVKNLQRRGRRVAANRRASITRQEQALSVRAQVNAFRGECLKYIDFRNDLRASVDVWRREIEKLTEKNHDRAAQVLTDGLKKVEAKFSDLDASVEKIRETFTDISSLESTDERLAYALDHYEVVEAARNKVFEILDDVDEIKERYDRVLAGKEPIEDLDANSDPDIQYPVDDEATVGICTPFMGKTEHEIERDDARDRAWVGARLDMADPNALSMEQYKELSDILDEWAVEQIAKENAEIRVESNEPEVVPQTQAEVEEHLTSRDITLEEHLADLENSVDDLQKVMDKNDACGREMLEKYKIDPNTKSATEDLHGDEIDFVIRSIHHTIEDLGVVETKTVEPDPVKTDANK